MAQQWQSLASEPRPETNDHPFPSSELVMPPCSVRTLGFGQNPWLQELEMDVTIRKKTETAAAPACCRYQDQRVTTRTTRRRKKVLKRAKMFLSSGLAKNVLAIRHFPHRRHERRA